MIKRERKLDSGTLQKHDFFWDGDDRLRSIKNNQTGATIWTAEYNEDGIRTRKTEFRGPDFFDHKYSYGPWGLLFDSHPSHVYTPGWGHRSNGINTFYHSDWLGSTRWTSDITGNTFPQALRFDAYGNRSATGDPANWRSTVVSGLDGSESGLGVDVGLGCTVSQSSLMGL